MDAGLFKQYEADYCTKSTELSKTIENLAALSAGVGRCMDSNDVGHSWVLPQASQGLGQTPTITRHQVLGALPCSAADQRRASARELEAAVREAEQLVSPAALPPTRPPALLPAPPCTTAPCSPPPIHQFTPLTDPPGSPSPPSLPLPRLWSLLLQLQRMEMEARSYSPDQARQLLQKTKEYKADLLKLKEDARRATTAGGGGGAAGEATRAELGLGADFYQTSAGQRDRLLTATDRLGKTSDRIQQGRQQLLETEVRAGRGLLDNS